jgi:hypothetical protein
VKGYLGVDATHSRKLALRIEANAFGFVVGKPSHITVLDIDTADEHVLAEALERHGPSPFVVRSGSGNWQA